MRVGKRVPASDGVSVTPRVGLAWSDVSLKDFTDGTGSGAKVSVKAAESLTGRVGASVESETGDGLRLFGSVDVTHEFSEETEAAVSGTALKASAERTTVRVGVGGSLDLGNGASRRAAATAPSAAGRSWPSASERPCRRAAARASTRGREKASCLLRQTLAGGRFPAMSPVVVTGPARAGFSAETGRPEPKRRRGGGISPVGNAADATVMVTGGSVAAGANPRRRSGRAGAAKRKLVLVGEKESKTLRTQTAALNDFVRCALSRRLRCPSPRRRSARSVRPARTA